MSNERRPSRPSSNRPEQEYDSRRRDSAPRSGSSRSGSRYYDEYDRPRSGEGRGRPSERPSESRANGSRPSGNRPAGSRPSGNRPSSTNRTPVKRPVKRRRRRIPVLPILFLVACAVIIVLIFKACSGKEPLPDEGSFSLEFIPSQAMIVGDTGEVRVLGLPEGFTGSIRWTSSNSSVLEVTDGKMKAKNPGEALVAAVIDGETFTGMSGTVVVHPVPENIKSITLNHSAPTLLSGNTLQLEAVILLDDGTEQTGLPVSWISDNIPVASVAGGLVTARDVGTATITAKLGNQSASCTITVQKSTDGVPVESGEGYGDPTQTGEGAEGNTGEAAATPPATTPPATTPPAATPPATTPPANQTPASHQSSGGSSVTLISLSQNTGNLDVGGSMTLGATVSPSNATVSWSSSNPSVATVSPAGVVTAVGAGDVVITATAGNISANCAVQVSAASVDAEGGGASDPGHP